jgi:hypothetical protein
MVAVWCRFMGICSKKPVVHVGDIVDMGDLIGLMGSTDDAAGGGYSTGVHLHLTIKINGKYVDPLKYFPEIKGYTVTTQHPMGRRIALAAMLIAVGNITSRLIGVIREAVFAATFRSWQ